MKWAALFIVCLLALASCKETKSTSDPWVNICEDLTWLDSIQGTILQSGLPGEIYLTHYKESRVFEVNVCNGCTDIPIMVYNCEGTVVCELGGLAGLNTCPDYAPKPDEKLLYWKSD